MLSFLDASSSDGQSFWVNTSANDLIRDQLIHVKYQVLPKIQALIGGDCVRTRIEDQVSIRELQRNEVMLWSLLLFTGYLTVSGKSRIGDQDLYELVIPNREVRQLFKNIYETWFTVEIGQDESWDMLEALIAGDLERFQAYFQKLVEATFSFYDTAFKEPERVYHMFVLGLLAQMGHRYHIRSNRESALGRYDIMMIPKTRQDPGLVIEFKLAKQVADLDSALATGLAQIQSQNYRAELEAHGVTKIREIALAFCGKTVKIRSL